MVQVKVGMNLLLELLPMLLLHQCSLIANVPSVCSRSAVIQFPLAVLPRKGNLVPSSRWDINMGSCIMLLHSGFFWSKDWGNLQRLFEFPEFFHS